MVNSNRAVINASPLIMLGKIEHLELLESFAASIVVPRSVIQEIGVGSDIDIHAEATLAWAELRAVAERWVDRSGPETGWRMIRLIGG